MTFGFYALHYSGARHNTRGCGLTSNLIISNSFLKIFFRLCFFYICRILSGDPSMLGKLSIFSPASVSESREDHAADPEWHKRRLHHLQPLIDTEWTFLTPCALPDTRDRIGRGPFPPNRVRVKRTHDDYLKPFTVISLLAARRVGSSIFKRKRSAAVWASDSVGYSSTTRRLSLTVFEFRLFEFLAIGMPKR